VGWQVMREMALLLLAGIAIGLPITLLGTRLLRGMLYGLAATDPLSVGGAVFLLVCAGLLAGYLPARRASRINPLTALRYE
jgi:ABC-type antimicrobial peptide transport system permease subunit